MNKTLSKTILSAVLAGVVMTSGAGIMDSISGALSKAKGAASNMYHKAKQTAGVEAKTYAAMDGQDQVEDRAGNKVFTNSKGQIFTDKYGRKVDAADNYEVDADGNPIVYVGNPEDNVEDIITADGKVEQLS